MTAAPHDGGSARRTALVVEVPEAEPVVARHRAELDGSSSLGVPAHCTVFFPFVPLHALDDELRGRLRAVFASSSAFEHRFSRTDWFGDDVLWLAPDDPAPFRALTEAVQRVCPDIRTYDGAFDEVVPHLTVAHRADLAVMRAVEQDVVRELPVVGRADQVSLLLENDAGLWTLAERFPLGRVDG